MKTLILLLAVLAVANAMENFFSLGEYADEMGVTGQGCCLPTQWEGRVGAVHVTKRFLKPKIRASDSKIGLDFAGQKVGVRSMFYCPKTRKVYTVQTIADYNAKKAYLIYGKKCKAFRLKRQLRKPCIPDFFKQFNPYFYGAGGSSLALSPYGYRNASHGLELFSVVTQDSCVPVKGAYRIRRGRLNTMGNYQYFNITVGNTDTDLYNVTKFCSSPELNTYESRGMWRKFRNFVGYAMDEPFNTENEFGELVEKDTLTHLMDIVNNNAMMMFKVNDKEHDREGRDRWYQRGWDRVEGHVQRMRSRDD